ncbi:unnamed protein product [Moneuplotes crassus]|uniref:Uncharacterized protein n=1 Tax=Euplotes crassus TaxID=5936 RepID=A0AAD1XL01_EUPCR|nr:unnamed protein product [Moneuplotes crassus]
MTDKKYLPKIRDYLGHTNKSDGTEKIENPFDRFSNSDDKQRKPRPWKYDEESGLAPTRVKKLNRQTFDGPEFSSPIAYSIIPKSTSIHSQHQGNLTKFENKCTKSLSMQYLQSETAEKIISNTLPGYLICLLKKCGSMTEKSIKFCMTASGDFIKLKKVNGIPYTSDPERAIRGALYSRGLFIKDEQGNWSIIKDRCTQYFDEEVEKNCKKICN